MGRRCNVCDHPKRDEIDRLLVLNETSLRNVSKQYGLTTAALHRHKAGHLAAILAQAAQINAQREEERAVTLQTQAKELQAQEEAYALDVMEELKRCFQRVNLLFDACDRWLRDPDDPTRYDLGPRAEDVQITYLEPGPDDKPIRRKAPISELLARIEGADYSVVAWETKRADPRDLILKTANSLQGQIELMAKLMGKLQEGATVNVLVAPEWLNLRTVILQVLEPYPDAKIALANALEVQHVPTNR